MTGCEAGSSIAGKPGTAAEPGPQPRLLADTGELQFKALFRCVVACPDRLLLMCGCQNGSIAALAWSRGGVVDAALRPTAPTLATGEAAGSFPPVLEGAPAAVPGGVVERLQLMARAPNAHGGTAVGMLRVTCSASEEDAMCGLGELQVLSAGRDHEVRCFRCVCVWICVCVRVPDWSG